MPKIKANGIELYYEIHGKGKPLVLMSGIGYSLWEWHRMVPFLERHFQVIAFDNRGAGQSEKPPGPYNAQLLAADTAGLLDALGIKQAIVMGHSMGGFIAQALALDFPEKVTRLILCSTNFGGPRHIPVTEEAMKVLGDVSSDPMTRFRNGLVVSTAPGWAEHHPELIQECLGYWKNPQATAEALRDEWFHTGDMARTDAEGFFYIVGRFKDMIISGGENIYAAEVEAVFREHPAVADAALIGQPDEKWGETGLMIVACKPDQSASAEELLQFCQGRLAKYKIPRRIEFVASLPYSPYGKVVKAELKRQWVVDGGR